MATKKEILDILNTVGLTASMGNFLNFGISGVIEKMRKQALSGEMEIFEGKGHWLARGAGSDDVVLKPVEPPPGAR